MINGITVSYTRLYGGYRELHTFGCDYTYSCIGDYKLFFGATERYRLYERELTYQSCVETTHVSWGQQGSTNICMGTTGNHKYLYGGYWEINTFVWRLQGATHVYMWVAGCYTRLYIWATGSCTRLDGDYSQLYGGLHNFGGLQGGTDFCMKGTTHICRGCTGK